ncbi:MAG: response regulator [Chloroflexota bacterium]|nr:response regulator [Chloroflexota bacterium]
MEPQPIDILLVEDNPDHVELTLKALGDNKFVNEVYWVSTGEEALDFLNRRGEYADAPRPGLILLDIKLPKMDGIECIRRLKSDPRLTSIPVVVLTTSADDRDITESYDCGANSYIVKPMDFEQFDRVVKDLKRYWLIINRVAPQLDSMVGKKRESW